MVELNVVELRDFEVASDDLDGGDDHGLFELLGRQVHQQHEVMRLRECIAILYYLLDEIGDVGEQILQLGVAQSQLDLDLRIRRVAMLVQLLLEVLARVLSEVLEDLVVCVCGAFGDLLILLDPLPLSIDPHVFHVGPLIVARGVEVLLLHLDGPRPLVGQSVQALHQFFTQVFLLLVECFAKLFELVN